MESSRNNEYQKVEKNSKFTNNPSTDELDLLQQLKSIVPEEYERGYESTLEQRKSSTTRRSISPRAREINWSEIRRHYVVGKHKQLDDGMWVTEDYTYKELGEKFQVNLNSIKKKASTESWTKLRKAYLARVNNKNITQELGLYTTENYQAEISAMNACNKLGVVLDHYIEANFRDILEAVDDTSITDSADRVDAPIDIKSITEAVKVAKEIYGLQRQIYENSPKTEMEIIEELTNKPKYRTQRERDAAIVRLKASLEEKLALKADMSVENKQD